jgi:hypothetical protein
MPIRSLTHISLDGLVLTNADSQGVTTEFRFNDEKPGLFSGGTAL